MYTLYSIRGWWFRRDARGWAAEPAVVVFCHVRRWHAVVEGHVWRMGQRHIACICCVCAVYVYGAGEDWGRYFLCSLADSVRHSTVSFISLCECTHTHAHTLPYRLLVNAYALYVCVCVLNRFGARFHLYHSLVYDGIPCSRVYFCVPASAAAVLFINILGGRCSCRWWSPSLHFGSI